MENRNLIGKRLQKAREILSEKIGRKLSQADVAKLCGWDSQARISHYEKGRRTPQGDDLQCLSQALDVSPEWILFGRGQSSTFSKDAPQTNVVFVPVISWSEVANWEQLYPDYKANRHISLAKNIGLYSFALIIEGDSMSAITSPSFPEGYTIVVDPDYKPKHRSFVIYNTSNDSAVAFRQLLIEGTQSYLKALNPNYPNAIQAAPADINIIGVVRELVHTFK